jgi:hypothetical protein
MANTDKNIVITPNRGSSSDDPKIVFSGADASTSAQNITAKIYPTSNGTLSFEGSAGQLFSITNDFSGTIFSVNDVSGIPSIEVLDTGEVKLAEYNGFVNIKGTTNSTSVSTGVLQVAGGVGIAGNLYVGGTINGSVSGSAGSLSNALTMNNSGSGVASGTTFDGSVARTISYNTLGASPLAGSGSLTTVGTITSGVWNASNVTSSGYVSAASYLQGAYIGVSNTTGTNGRGISLYGGAVNGQPSYGLMFQQTGTFGTHGNVTADWATYFTMNNTANRGWIFRDMTSGLNRASISNLGDMSLTRSLGVGTAGSGTAGEIRATNEITAYYSDRRLKTDVRPISNAIEKVMSLNGIIYRSNDVAKEYGFTTDNTIVGLFADEVEAVLPEAVRPAPFDLDANNESKSGKNYKTIQYEKVVPLLVEAIKEQQLQINKLYQIIDELKNSVNK